MRYNPYYVHSHIENFNGNLAGLGISPTQRREDIINELTTLRNQLESATNNFLGGTSPEKIWQDINDPTVSLSGIGMDILRRKSKAFTKILEETGVFYNVEQLNDIFGTELANVLIDHFQSLEWYKENDIIKYITDVLWEKLSWAVTEKGGLPKNIIADVFTGQSKTLAARDKISFEVYNLFDSEFLREFGEKYYNSQFNVKDTFRENIKKKLSGSKYTEGAKKGSYIDKAIELFRVEFMNEFNKRIDDGTIAYLREDADEYLDKFEKTLRQNQMVDVVNTSHVYGVLGENFFEAAIQASTITVGPNSVSITTTGSYTEKEVRTKIFPSEADLTRQGWLNINKESQSDLLIHYQGRTARAQAKNYASIYQALIHGNVNMVQAIKTFEDKSIVKFLEQIASTGNVLGGFNQDELTYALANTIWFSKVGDIDSGEKMSMGTASRLAEELSLAAINFLGVIIDENIQVIPELSNLFYILNNAALIPVYQIIDKLIERLSGVIEGRQIFTLTLDMSSIKFAEPSKEKFYQEKLKRMNQEPSLIAYASKQGQRIINSTQIKAGRMNLLMGSDGNLVPTSYTG